jgi:hypothetical protein
MKRFTLFAILSVLLVPAAVLAAKDAQPQFKTIVVKPLTGAEGITLPQGAAEAFSEHLRNKLQKMNLAAQVTDDGSKVAEADAAGSVVIEAKVTSNNPMAKSASGAWLLGVGAAGHIAMEIGIFRLSDHTLIKTITPNFKDTGCGSDSCQRRVIGFMGEDAADAIKKALK